MTWCRLLILLTALSWGQFALSAFGTETALIESGSYASEAEAQAAWKPLTGSPPVGISTTAGRHSILFPCSFAAGKLERGVWDKAVSLNLRSGQSIQFEFMCPDSTPVSYFSIYFQSGGGWFHGMFYPEKSGVWSTISIAKSAFVTEGQPSGWDKISGMRISAWRGGDKDTSFQLSNLRQVGVLGADARIAIVRAKSVAAESAERKRAVDRYTETVVQHLETGGVKCAVLDDTDVHANQLASARVVILPFNPTMPEPALAAIASYMTNGGKLLGFYTMPEPLVVAGGMRRASHVRANTEGMFASIVPFGSFIPGAPPRTRQNSWNINPYEPSAGQSRVLAEWRDKNDQPSGYAAVVGSSNLVVVSHVLLNEDPQNKQRLVLSLAGLLDPDVWREAAEAALNTLGRISSYENFSQAYGALVNQGRDKSMASSALARARSLRDEAAEQASRREYVKSTETSAAAAVELETAFCAAQEARLGEFRGFWCHSAFGVKGLSWDEAIRRLATNGFTAILPNMLWGGAAYYQSELLPKAKDLGDKGDQIAECLAACRKYGIELHAWKVNWNLGHAVPEEFLRKMRDEKRLQRSTDDKEEPWLCPSHPENQKLEVASMVELARRYELDGIHFDYIRYPDTEHCYCDGCKERFATSKKVSYEKWPKDVLEGGRHREAWVDWRRANITSVVKAVSEQARTVRPKLKISAAVFPNWNTDRDRIGQDWKLWCEKGYLDFVCPMDYTPSNNNFLNLVGKQVAWAGKVPCYPGIGVSASSSHFGADKVIDQIHIARKTGAGGFVIFNYAVPESTELLPKLGAGITSRR